MALGSLFLLSVSLPAQGLTEAELRPRIGIDCSVDPRVALPCSFLNDVDTRRAYGDNHRLFAKVQISQHLYPGLLGATSTSQKDIRNGERAVSSGTVPEHPA